MVLIHCIFSQYLLSLYEVTTKALEQFRSYASGQDNLIKRNNSKTVSNVELRLLYTALTLVCFIIL